VSRALRISSKESASGRSLLPRAIYWLPIAADPGVRCLAIGQVNCRPGSDLAENAPAVLVTYPFLQTMRPVILYSLRRSIFGISFLSWWRIDIGSKLTHEMDYRSAPRKLGADRNRKS
jgi:hypothetical protein